MPIAVLRIPDYLGPHFYCACIAYTALSNAGMVALGLHADAPGLARRIAFAPAEVWCGLAAATAAAAIGAATMAAFMSPSHRWTFWRPRTLRRHILDWHWNQRQTAPRGR